MLEGHAFIVEAAVSVGGRDMKQGINVHRFANRIPLLFEVPYCMTKFMIQISLITNRRQCRVIYPLTSLSISISSLHHSGFKRLPLKRQSTCRDALTSGI